MGAGKRSVNQVPRIGATRTHLHAGDYLTLVAHTVNVAKFQAGVNALTVKVKRQGHQIYVPGALTLAKQTAFNALSAGAYTQFSCGHSATAIIVGV